MLHGLLKWLIKPVVPSGYRPGATLKRLQGDLQTLDCSPVGGATLRCIMPNGLVFSVHEKPQALFISHTVACEFILPLPNFPLHIKEGQILIQHTGVIRRQGIHCKVSRQKSTELTQMAKRLQADPSLTAVLLPLDFRHCELRRNEIGWQLCIEHFGASEIVHRIPAMRRYIRLTDTQRNQLFLGWKKFLMLKSSEEAHG